MAQRPAEVEKWLADLSVDQRRRATELADLVHAADDGVAEAVKWGRLAFTVDGNWHHWLCAIGVTKAGVKLLFHKGALLEDPTGLLEGDSRYVRQIPYGAATDHPQRVAHLVQEAIAHQTDTLDDRA